MDAGIAGDEVIGARAGVGDQGRREPADVRLQGEVEQTGPADIARGIGLADQQFDRAVLLEGVGGQLRTAADLPGQPVVQAVVPARARFERADQDAAVGGDAVAVQAGVVLQGQRRSLDRGVELEMQLRDAPETAVQGDLTHLQMDRAVGADRVVRDLVAVPGQPGAVAQTVLPVRAFGEPVHMHRAVVRETVAIGARIVLQRQGRRDWRIDLGRFDFRRRDLGRNDLGGSHLRRGHLRRRDLRWRHLRGRHFRRGDFGRDHDRRNGVGGRLGFRRRLRCRRLVAVPAGQRQGRTRAAHAQQEERQQAMVIVLALLLFRRDALVAQRGQQRHRERIDRIRLRLGHRSDRDVLGGEGWQVLARRVLGKQLHSTCQAMRRRRMGPMHRMSRMSRMCFMGGGGRQGFGRGQARAGGVQRLVGGEIRLGEGLAGRR